MTILPGMRQIECSLKSNLVDASSEVLIAVIGQEDLASKSATFAQLDSALKGFISENVTQEAFSGKWGQSLTTYLPKGMGFQRLILLGAGEKNSSQPLARCRQLAMMAAELLNKWKTPSATLFNASELFCSPNQLEQWPVGLHQGFYSYPKLGTSDPSEPSPSKIPFSCVVIGSGDALIHALKSGEVLGQAIVRCRLLQDGPPNIVTPESFAQVCQQRAQEAGLAVSVWGRATLEEKGFKALLAVSAGSSFEPQLVQASYTPPQYEKTLVLVGKGLTMDAGGYSLKPPSSQIGMKYDMSGAAVVMSAIEAISQLKLPIRVVALGVMCENMVDAKAYRVNDVITGYSGKSIEVLNTDAEGRIVLSDALSFADKELKPDLMVNFATLTGAMLITLGHFSAGCFAFENTLAQTVVGQASEQTGERVHFLPVYEEVYDEFKSSVADMANIAVSDPGKAGSMLSAAFLKNFSGNTPFAHIDIAGVADGNKALGYPRKGGAGYGVQLAVAMAQILSKN